MRELQRRTAFITGGASGIGLGMARAFLGAGMNIVVADIRDDHLATASAELGEEKALVLKLDVTDRVAFAAAADAADARFGAVHLLANNAGVAVVGPVSLASYSDWDWTLSVNLGGVINGLQTFLPRMLAHGQGGHIVNTASMSGLLPHPGAAIYATTKGAVIALCEAIRPELEPLGIVVSAFCPGPVQSNIAESGKSRPSAFADTGYAESDKRRQKGGDHFHLFRTADEVGARVLEGVRNDELFILTHSEFREGLAERAAAIVAAVPNIPRNPALESQYPMLLRNPAHAADIERRRKS